MKSAGQLDVGEAGSIELEFLLKGLNALAGLHGGRTGHGADQGFLAEHGFALWRCHTWHGAVPSSERESILRVAACWRKPESWVCAARFEPRISLCCIRATRAGAALISVYPAGDKTARLNGADPPSLVRQALFFQKKVLFS